MHSVTVLMSTYNGEKYIEEQLDSILRQNGVTVNLIVRDDGSSDSTQKILNKYAERGKLKWYTGNNLRAAYSFLDLIKNAPVDEYYAFSDQDDVWDYDKLISAVTTLEKFDKNKAVLYSCSALAVSADLQPIEEAKFNIPVTEFVDGLIHNNHQGCTMVFGRVLMDILKRYDGKNLCMHDDLAMKICLASGGILFKDDKKLLYYRQHGNNVIGTGEKFAHAFKRRIKAFFAQSCERSKELKDIYEIYKDIIPAENREILEKVAFYKERTHGKFQVIFDKRIKASDKKTTRHFRIGILLGFF